MDITLPRQKITCFGAPFWNHLALIWPRPLVYASRSGDALSGAERLRLGIRTSCNLNRRSAKKKMVQLFLLEPAGVTN